MLSTPGGTAYLRAAAALPAPPAVGSTHRLEVRAIGSTLEGWWDGVRLLQTLDNFQQAATAHGLYWDSTSDPTATYDNFQLKRYP